MFTYKDYYIMVGELLGDVRRVYFRHDVDISLDKALEMAEREYKMSLTPSCYYILPTSPYYNIFSEKDSRKVKTIIDMGHKIGLHYDLTSCPDNLNMKADRILMFRDAMENVFDVDISVCSSHKPFMGKAPDRELAIELQKVGLHEINITMPDYKYISDSGMNWREDYRDVMKNHVRIHVNTHPEWYGEEEATWEQRIKELNLKKDLDKLIKKEILGIRQYHERLLRRDLP